jgi:YCII-related domain
MPTFVLTHRAPAHYAPSAQSAAAWNAWFERLGSNLADRGNPVFARRSLGDCGSDTALGGYTLITADDLQSAVALANGCPVLAAGGGVEIGELTPLNSGRRALA